MILDLLAEEEHKQWVKWTKELVRRGTVTDEETIARWRSLWIPYNKLTEDDKDKDRYWAKRTVEILAKFTEVQTRSEENGLRFFKTIDEAMKHAQEDKTVWKVSFSVGNERVRMVRDEGGRFNYEPLPSWVPPGARK